MMQQRALSPAGGRPSVRAAASSGGGGGGLGDGDELDVAVFRFTLGIPGFDDRLVPRVVGIAAGAALAANRLLGAQPVPDAQARAELLGALLAALLLVTPELEERLRAVLPGRGRQQAADAVAGAARVFALAGALPDAERRELAWATFALLKNANCCGLVVLRGGGDGGSGGSGGATAVAARGAVGSGVSRASADETLAAISAVG